MDRQECLSYWHKTALNVLNPDFGRAYSRIRATQGEKSLYLIKRQTKRALPLTKD
jgi:hypothetical protein